MQSENTGNTVKLLTYSREKKREFEVSFIKSKSVICEIEKCSSPVRTSKRLQKNQVHIPEKSKAKYDLLRYFLY
jgi:hypothetical protein